MRRCKRFLNLEQRSGGLSSSMRGTSVNDNTSSSQQSDAFQFLMRAGVNKNDLAIRNEDSSYDFKLR